MAKREERGEQGGANGTDGERADWDGDARAKREEREERVVQSAGSERGRHEGGGHRCPNEREHEGNRRAGQDRGARLAEGGPECRLDGARLRCRLTAALRSPFVPRLVASRLRGAALREEPTA